MKFIYGSANNPEVTDKLPRFVPKHTAEYRYLGESKTRKEKVPDRIIFKGAGFDVNAIDEVKTFKSYSTGVTCDARVMTEADEVALNRINAEIQDLQAERLALKQAAFQRGRRVRKSDCAVSATEPQPAQ